MFPATTPFALFDDNLAAEGDLLLRELRAHVVCASPDELEPALRAIEAARARGEWVALAAHYELGLALEPRLAPLLPARGAPLLEAWCFGEAQRVAAPATDAALAAWLAARDERERHAGVAALRRTLDVTQYCAQIERIRALIAAGECYQVNFTFGVEGEVYGDPLALYARLREAQPVRYGAFIRHPRGTILSRSPELFFSLQRGALTCRPMKGTAPRDSDPALLAASEKNRAENVMIVDLIRNDLGRLVPPGGVRVTRLCEVEGYRSVWQMTSTVEAAPVSAALGALLRALHPCGSVTGAPKIRAMELIAELEAGPRGLYCGALGWLAPDGSARLSVPIRTLEVDAERRLRLGLGSGIVADSEPVAEWQECLLKGRFVSELAPTFGLIETLRCEPGTPQPYPLLELHLERLAASAHHLGFACDTAAVRAALLGAAAACSGPSRVRLQLAADGRWELRSAPLDPLPPGPAPRVTLNPERIDSRDPLQRHKTTLRTRYDQALAAALRAGHFDTLFLNERDELAEGARSNVFLDLGDGPLATPPLESGALDGVYRRKLLQTGAARVARLSAADLYHARAIYLGNALRGLIAVELVADQG